MSTYASILTGSPKIILERVFHYHKLMTWLIRLTKRKMLDLSFNPPMVFHGPLSPLDFDCKMIKED